MSEHHIGTMVERPDYCTLNQRSLFDAPERVVNQLSLFSRLEANSNPNKAAIEPEQGLTRSKNWSIRKVYKENLSYYRMLEYCKRKPNSTRNCAFLRGLMTHLGRALTDDASIDLMADELVDSYLQALGRNPNRTSALSYLRIIVKEPTERSFAEIASSVVNTWIERGGSISSLARHVGMSTSTLWGYANGTGKPSKRKTEELGKLEMVGGLQPGTLTKHIISWQSSGFVVAKPYFDLKNPFYSYEQIGTPTLPLPARLIEHIQLFFEFKTCPDANASVELQKASGQELLRTTIWTPGTKPANLAAPFAKWNDFSSVLSNLAAIAKLCSFVDPVRGTSADTLAVCLDTKTVERVLRRDMLLAGGFNNGHQNFVRIISHLLHPDHGFLVQFPDVFLPEANRIGLDTEGLPWREFVAKQYGEVYALPNKLVPEKSSGSRVTSSRDKKSKLHEILILSNLYSQVVYPTLKRLYAEMPPSYAPEIVKLDFEIKYLTLVLFAVCPMRLLNWAYAEWDSNLRKRGDNWWVEIPKQKVKTRRSVKKDYSFLLPDWASKIVDRYFKEVKPRMARSNPDAERLVLAGPHRKKEEAKNSKTNYNRRKAGKLIYSSIKHRMSKITEQLWNVAVTPHDWRDLYATDYLNKYPGEILIVAAALNDTVATVLKHYAQPDTARLSRIAAQTLDAEWVAVP